MTAPELFKALVAAKCPYWVHNAALTNDIEALRRIALFYSNWNNNTRCPAIAAYIRAKRPDLAARGDYTFDELAAAIAEAEKGGAA